MRKGFVLLILITIPASVYVVTWMKYTQSVSFNHIQEALTLNQFRQVQSPTAINTNGKPIKVILVAYFRTGSTFTAELLSHLEGSFYIFEPLHTYYQQYRKYSKTPVLLNGTVWWQYHDGYELSYAQHVLHSLLNCDFLSVDKFTLIAFSRHSAMLSRYRTCLRNSQDKRQEIDVCLKELTADCLKAPVRLVKTIRTPMSLAHKMMDKDPNIKIIHLLRDPRGHLRSFLAHDSVRDKKEFVIERECRRIGKDIKDRQLLEKMYPGCSMEIIYETLSQHPEGVLKKLYKWLQIPVGQKTINWLKNATKNSADGSFFETYRKNSTLTAYMWMNKTKFSFISTVNKYCGTLIQHGQFPLLLSESELHSFEIPNRTV